MKTTTEIMELARHRHLADLPLPRSYRPGKFTALGFPKEGRATVCEVRGPGVLKRLWTTHAAGTSLKIYLYIDDDPEPALEGMAHDIARAAGRISCPDLPLGGFLDGKSVSLYLPYRFETGFRLEAEATEETGDGPYWQIDYALHTDEKCGRVEQTRAGERAEQERSGELVELEYHEAEGGPELAASDGAWQELEDEFAVAGCSPHSIQLDGPAVIRRITLTGEALDKLWLRLCFDTEPAEDGHVSGPFQVDAPLQYLVGPFNNAGVGRLGSQMEIHFPMPFRERADIQVLPAMGEGEFGEQYRVKMKVAYEEDPPRVADMHYFHARYAAATTNGYDDFEVCSTEGKGHFVGVHLFDTGHDHGGGDNLLLDAGLDTAQQLHGICGEDYFHHAYMRVGMLGPYAGCPSHSARYRHHLEMPIPFDESFVFNWGEFAGQAPKAVAFWYQREPAGRDEPRDLTYRVAGTFPLALLDELRPGERVPNRVCPWPGRSAPARSWHKRSQRGFVDLCHAYRHYLRPVPPSDGVIPSDLCTYLETAVWAERQTEAELIVGCDDPIRVYLGADMALADEGRREPDPFRAFRASVELQQGINRITVVVGNTPNANWHWNGFSLVLETDLSDRELLYLS